MARLRCDEPVLGFEMVDETYCLHQCIYAYTAHNRNSKLHVDQCESSPEAPHDDVNPYNVFVASQVSHVLSGNQRGEAKWCWMSISDIRAIAARHRRQDGIALCGAAERKAAELMSLICDSCGIGDSPHPSRGPSPSMVYTVRVRCFPPSFPCSLTKYYLRTVDDLRAT